MSCQTLGAAGMLLPGCRQLTKWTPCQCVYSMMFLAVSGDRRGELFLQTQGGKHFITEKQQARLGGTISSGVLDRGGDLLLQHKNFNLFAY